jgi:hypothetical protein
MFLEDRKDFITPQELHEIKGANSGVSAGLSFIREENLAARRGSGLCDSPPRRY